MTPILKKLSLTIKAKIKSFGGDWKDYIYDDPVSCQGWRSPPLAHSGSIYGINNRDLMQVSISLSLLEFVDAYEDYLKLCAAGRYGSVQGVGAMFGLTAAQAEKLFPDADHDRKYNYIPAIASLAISSYSGDLVIEDFSRYVVSVEGFNFGMDRGMPVSNYLPGEHPEDKDKTVKPSLIFGRRRELSNTKLAERMSTIYKGVKDLPMSEQDRRELKDAMIMVIYHEDETLHDEWLVGKSAIHSYPKMVLDSLETAKTFRAYLDPIGFLRDLLVPFVLSNQELSSRFGKSQRVNPDRLDEIGRDLDELIKNLKDESEKIC